MSSENGKVGSNGHPGGAGSNGTGAGDANTASNTNGKPRTLPEALAKNIWQPGQSGNPKGRPSVPSFAGRLSKLYPLKASERGWAATVARKLGLDPNVVTIGDLVAEASTLNAIRGRSNYLREINDRCEGKVAQNLNIDAVVTPGSVSAARRQLGFAEEAMIEIGREETSGNGHPVVDSPTPLEG